MKIISVIARFLLGLIFLVFGLNGFFHFLSMPAPTGVAGQFMGALFVSNFLIVIFVIQLIGAVLLLGQSLRSTRADAARTDYRQHSAFSPVNGAKRCTACHPRSSAVGSGVLQRSLGLRWPVATTGRGASFTLMKSQRKTYA